MKIVGEYSFKRGRETVMRRYPRLLAEVKEIIKGVDPAVLKAKISKEKTMPGRMLCNPRAINAAFDREFSARGWKKVRVPCEYPTNHYAKDYKTRTKLPGAFREMDFIKQKLGIEVQFGKYAFMVYNGCAKMTIFRNLGHIDTGIEIVPIKELAEEMSTGVSYFEQFVWDLDHRGVADIDIPVLILGVAA
ncbi:MAG: BglII/BstYI family type II restriction endonuclease [Candidatus Binataceae bacterium]